MKKLIFVIIIGTVMGENPPFSFNGWVDFAHISRLSDYSIIDIPYRMASLDFIHQSENLSINGNFTLEYQIRRDSYFLESKDPQDFRLDMRELYATYSGSNYEFRVGKQIHSWGSVDENSPLDNASAFDYYYIFFLGTERKMATMSGALDYYIGNLKLNAVFSPIHTTNRVPLGDDDFPITLPIYPTESQMFPVSDLPYEGGIQGTFSFGMGEVSASYFSGYDRTFNLTGINAFGNGQQVNPDLSFAYIDIVFGYRKTNIFGMGGVFLTDWFILRGDLGYFSTKDQNSNVERESPWLPSYYDNLWLSTPLLEKSNYLQSTIQFETELPFNINIIAQYFTHDTLNYSAGSIPVDSLIKIPNLEIDPEDMTPANFFTPGMGVPLAILTDKAAILILDKTFMNEQLNVSLTTMLDLGDYEGVEGIPGSLTEYKIEYNITQDFLGLLGVTKVIGSKDHPDGEQYQFNKMEDFSHFRFELKYFF
jgi:hypothetical protein